MLDNILFTLSFVRRINLIWKRSSFCNLISKKDDSHIVNVKFWIEICSVFFNISDQQPCVCDSGCFINSYMFKHLFSYLFYENFYRNSNRIKISDNSNISNRINISDNNNISNTINISDNNNISNRINISDNNNISNRINISDNNNISTRINISDNNNISNRINISYDWLVICFMICSAFCNNLTKDYLKYRT